MNKNKIYKMVFEEIKESLDWADNYKDGTYYTFIDGVISLANRMIKELEKVNCGACENTCRE
jgi:hypothetical protein